MKTVDFDWLEGKTLTSVKNLSDEIVFTVNDGTRLRMFHNQMCCENVYVEDICGDLTDLVDSPIIFAYQSYEDGGGPKDFHHESYTWTFYRIATVKGTVVIRWYGSSNGYYGEGVDCYSD